MKKTVLIAIGLFFLLLLGGCQAKEQNDMELITTTTNKTVTVINGVTQADVWLLPDTQENRKTTLWGTATAAKVATDESRAVPLCAPGENGLYLLRMIDVDQFYYSASGIALTDGDTITVTGEAAREVTVTVTAADGTVKATYDAFSARL